MSHAPVIHRKGTAWRAGATVAVAACALALAACGGGSSSSAQKAARLRLPISPDEHLLAPGPAVLDTIQPYREPAGTTHGDWQLSSTDLSGGWHLRYLVPLRWQVDRRGRAHSGDGLVRTQVEMTPVHDDQLSLAAYAATLAEGEPIYRLTAAGVPAYLTARNVSAAPSDPAIEAAWFHTLVLDLGGHIAKVECRYDATNRFRFYDVCTSVLGTVVVTNQSA